MKDQSCTRDCSKQTSIRALMENISLISRKKKLLFTSLGWSVLGKTVQFISTTGAQDLGHSVTQYRPSSR